MHLTRAKTKRIMPIARKGTKYIARAKSHANSGIPVAIALREMLGVAKNMKEARLLVHDRSISINGKPVKDSLESLRLFSVLGVKDALYRVNLLPSGRFVLEETKDKKRLCKIINKRLVKGGKIQLEMHDGTNVLESKDKKTDVGDSVELDFENKIIKFMHIEKGKRVFIIYGKNAGLHGVVENVLNGEAVVKLKDRDVKLNKMQIAVI